MIDHQLPKDWKDLQEKVAEILRDVGYTTETEKKLDTVRGPVEVDVFSEDTTQSPNIIYVCECKYWVKKVPKEVVHSFRTVMQDFGAHYGIIISKKGFQKGAFTAARNTNIALKDWFGFQEMFEDKWWPAISVKIYNQFDTLIRYTDIAPSNFKKRKWDQIGDDNIKGKKFAELLRKYDKIGDAILGSRGRSTYATYARGLS